MEATFITITGTNHYYGLKPFKVGGIVKLVKDNHNHFDSEAIEAKMPYIDTVGFVANSPNREKAIWYSPKPSAPIKRDNTTRYKKPSPRVAAESPVTIAVLA